MTRWLRGVVTAFLIALPLLAALVVYMQRVRLADVGIDIPLVVAGLCALFLLNLVVATRNALATENKSLAICGLAAVTAYSMQLFLVEPIDLYLHDTSGFVRHVESLMAQRPGKLVFLNENPDGLPIKYLVNATMDFQPLFIKSADEIKNIASPIWLLTKDENFERLRKEGFDTGAFVYHGIFARSPFSAIYIAAH